jgi:UDP-N-acetylmuramoyl-L-alanyl-D-glutamate--2,6-diaminopimelate ligase
VRLSKLLDGAGVASSRPPEPDVEVSGVRLDSRKVTEGDLFCALRGQKLNGDDFALQAIAGGARAVLSESPRPPEVDPAVAWIQVQDARRATGRLAREWHGRPDAALTLIGITGTCGKTSVVYLLESMAREAGVPAGRIGTVGYAHGTRERAAERTTPEAPDLFAMLSEMRDEGIRLVAMEVSSHALELNRVEGARFAAGCFLNLSRDHLDFHRDMERYFSAKAKLIEDLDPEAAAVLPADDPRGASLAARTRANVIRFGRSVDAEVRIAEEECALDGTRMKLATPGGEIRVRTSLIGRFTPDNVAAAAACALVAGLPAGSIAEGAKALARIPGRMEAIDCGQPFAVLVDFAHTEDALARALSSLRAMTEGRVLVVFGCGGDRDRGKRPAMGRVAAKLADVVVLTSDNPRSEDEMAILDAIRSGVEEIPGANQRCLTIRDRTLAAARAVGMARQGDVVLLAGKGHETTQSIGDRLVPLDDREIAREALAERGFQGGCRAHA